MTREDLPRCPSACGGQGADPASLLSEQRAFRKRWGCDVPAEIPTLAITCPRCGGDGSVQGVKCDRCKGRGEAELHRCPTSYQTPDVRQAIRCYRWAQDGTMPVPGGSLDQAASWIAFVRLFESERDLVRREQESARERKRKAKQMGRGGRA